MALGKYTRVDNRRSASGYCSTVTIVVFVALCLVGVWMMTSSSVVPVQNSDVPGETNKSEVKAEPEEQEKKNEPSGEQVSESNASPEKNEDNANQFEDSPGDLPDEATKGDIGGNENQEEKPEEKPEENNTEEKPEENNTEEKPEENNTEEKPETENGENDQKSEGTEETKEEEKAVEESEKKETNDEKVKENATGEEFPSGAQSELLNETAAPNSAWATQAAESKDEKEKLQSSSNQQTVYTWKLCNSTAGPDFIPCLDNLKAIRSLPSTKHYEHRERHCPEGAPTCLVPLPEGYQPPIEWPKSREKIWYSNVPHTKLVQIKGHQNWVKVNGEYLTFPGGGTQFKHGALHYIDFIQEIVPAISWGKQSRVVLDVGCGVASFGGFLFDRDVLTMSLAPKDEHEAQVQFALERGIPAISAVMGTSRLPFPGRVFDVVHCARCRVPWHIEGGKLLLELNRMLRPGGYFVWSATPVYQNIPVDVEIWNAMKELTKAMCWEVVTISRDTVNGVGIAVYKKPMTNECYEKRPNNEPPMCLATDDPNAAWNIPLEACMHKAPVDASERGSQWPKQWPARVEKTPYWLSSSQVGVYGKPAPEDFDADFQHWKRVVKKSYLNGIGINWSTVRNVMDMRAVYGGFAAALKELNLWVMNVVSVDSPDTLPIIYERGLFGMYHDWCESFSTYPRSYDLLHADHLFSKLKTRCNLVGVFAEVDRILRPEGKLIVRDSVEIINEIESMAKSAQWEVRLSYSKENEALLCVQKSAWRPSEIEELKYAIA